jgi:hypothetical protein
MDLRVVLQYSTLGVTSIKVIDEARGGVACEEIDKLISPSGPCVREALKDIKHTVSNTDDAAYS